MGILSATLRFTNPAPTGTDLANALSQHIGEVVTYEEESYELVCPLIEERIDIFALDGPQESTWEVRTLNLSGGYLWSATLVVLQKMGGVEVCFDNKCIPFTAPTWAYKPWRLAKREYRWRKWRKPVWVTPDEARRLGVE